MEFSHWRDSTDEERNTFPILCFHNNWKSTIERYALIKLYPNNIFYTDRLRWLNQCDMSLLTTGIKIAINYNKTLYNVLWRIEYNSNNKEDNYQYKKLDGKDHKIDFTFCHRSKRSYFIYNR